MLLNMGQLVYIIYQRRPVKFDPELEEAYQTLFHPFKVQHGHYHWNTSWFHLVSPCRCYDVAQNYVPLEIF
jgi:hypothetical protein